MIRPPDHRQKAVADVYDLSHRASPSASHQPGLDFLSLLHEASENTPDRWAVAVRDTVVNSWRRLHEEGLHFLSLYETAVVLMEVCRVTEARMKDCWAIGGGDGESRPRSD